MKNLIAILCSLIVINPSFAYQNLIISNSETISHIENLSPETISIEQVYTIMNERDSIIVEILNKGNAEFNLTLETGKLVNFELIATDTKTEVKNAPKGFNIFVIDDYIKSIELDLPPGVIE